METSLSSPSWQRAVYYPGFDQTGVDSGQYGRDHVFDRKASPRLSTHDDARSLALETKNTYGRPRMHEEFVSEEIGDNDFKRHRQYVDPPIKHKSHTYSLARYYHQHEEDQTDFRRQAMRDLNSEQRQFHISENQLTQDSIYIGNIQSTDSAPRYSVHDDGHVTCTHSDISDHLKEDFLQDERTCRSKPDEIADIRKHEIESGVDEYALDFNNFGHPTHGVYKAGNLRDSADEEYVFGEENNAEKSFYHSWHKDYNHDGENADWKKPDMHLFKASSYKGSVTSEKSSRLDPHTYQSYAAGLLYSSGRSEKFLKLQKHFAVLERIGELEKFSTPASHGQNAGECHDLKSSGQSFHSQEELFELSTELKEARKKKEFFYDTDRKDQIQWNPEKDFGLKNRGHTLRDQVRTYRNLTEDKTPKSSSSSTTKLDAMKRSVSFGALYEKFNTPETKEAEQESTMSYSRSYVDHKGKEADSQFLKSRSSEQTAEPTSVTLKQSVPSPSSVSYLELMENAAQKSKQRAIYGTYLDSPCNDYEAYVKQMKRIKKDSDVSSIDVHQSLSKPLFIPIHPESTSTSESESRDKPSYSSDTLQAHKDNRNLQNISPEIMIDSSCTPRPELKVRYGHDDDKGIVRPLSAVQSAVHPNAEHDTDLFSIEGEQSVSHTDICSGPVDRVDTAQSQTWPQRSKYSEMPDIIQMEKHYQPCKSLPSNPKSYSTTLPSHVNLDSQERPPSAHQAYGDLKAEGSRRLSSEEKQNQQFDHKEQRNPQQTEWDHPGTGEKSTVFHVKNLRNLAENNEFSVNQFSWMKKPNACHADRDAVGFRTIEPQAFTHELHEAAAKGRTCGGSLSVSAADAGKSPEDVLQGKNPFVQKPVSTLGQFMSPFDSSHNSATVEEKTFLAPKKPEALSFKPVPSQSGPVFSASKKGTESRMRQMESSRYNAFENALPYKYTLDSTERNIKHLETTGSEKGAKQMETVSTPTQNQGTVYSSETHLSQRAGKEDELKGAAMARKPGDGSDSYSQNLDKQYGQLRKWTAVADIYRDVEKSWSPTRETQSFPPENNSSISSTDTFIVKDTDGEQDDPESSVSSVSRLREIFERQQKVSKSRSEPDMLQDSNEEPRRPRSAKSQTDLTSIKQEEASPHPRMPRTVSGDLAEIRHHCNDEQQLSSFEPNRLTDHNRPTDVALKAWVQYTEKPKYDPYLPPEDILKEVSAASTGRKSDVPKQKNYRPSNVSRMTLEYFNQIGSEWQQSNKKGYIPLSSQSVRSSQCYAAEPAEPVHEVQPVQPDIQQLDRRYLSHQYVNEESPFTINYSETDDLKLKQSQWAGATGLIRESEENLPERTRNSDQRRGYFAPGQGNESTVSHSWMPPQIHKAYPVKTLTNQYEAKQSQMLSAETKFHTNATTTKQPASQPLSSGIKVQTAPTPADRSRSLPQKSQSPQLSVTETKSLQQLPSSQFTSQAADLPRHSFSPASKIPQKSAQHLNQNQNLRPWEEEGNRRKGPKEGPLQQPSLRPVPPEPARPPPASPVSPHRLPRPQPRVVQHSHSKSSDSEHSSGDNGAVYCVSTGSVLYGVEADEEEPAPPPPPSQPSVVSSSATFPRKNTTRQPFLQPARQGSGNPVGSYPTPRNPASSSSPTLGPTGTAPAPPTRGGSGGGTLRGAGTLPLPGSKPLAPCSSSLSAAEQLGVKSPPPSSAGLASGVSARSGTGATNPIPSATAAFKHQTSDERRPRPEPVNPEKERRRKEEEEAYRKKRLEELYEEERLKKMKKGEADAEARRHHDFYMNAQKSPISPNRFDDAPSSLSPSAPGSLGTLERKGPQLSIPPERRRGFQIQGKARAVFNFTAQNPRELPFRKNDIIFLLRQVDKNWFEGERHGRVGIFPTNYVEVVTSIEAAQAAAMQAEGQGRAKYNFTAQSSVELSLRKGEFVVLLRRVDENWYEGRIGNRQGIFPVSYVEITHEPSTPLITPAPSVITTPMTGTPEMLSPVGYDPAPTPPPQPSPSALMSQRSPYSYPQQPGYGPGTASLLAPASSLSRQQVNLSRQEPDFGSPRSPISNPKSPVSPGRPMGSPGRRVSPGPSHGSGPMSRLHVDVHSSAKPFTNGPPAASSASKITDDDLAVTRYRALYAYRPQNEDELELREGDEVFVMEKCDDGWFVGTSARTGCFGTFPGNYVQKICK